MYQSCFFHVLNDGFYGASSNSVGETAIIYPHYCYYDYVFSVLG